MSVRQAVQFLITLAAVGTMSACAAGTAELERRPRSVTPYLDRSVTSRCATIDIVEIRSIDAVTAFEVIERLRPEFLRGNHRGEWALHGPSTPDVFLNSGLAGGLEALRTIPVRAIQQIRWVGAVDAQMWFGPGHSAWVIVVRTR